MQQARQHAGTVGAWTAPVMRDALQEEVGLTPPVEGGPELTEDQQFGSRVAQSVLRHTRDRARDWIQKREEGALPAMDEAEVADTSLLANVKDKAARFVSWLKPAAGDAIQEGTGVDAYDFLGKEQPELSRDQRFASKALRAGAAVFVARMAARAAA